MDALEPERVAHLLQELAVIVVLLLHTLSEHEKVKTMMKRHPGARTRTTQRKRR